jgi:hypothetical protein
MRTAVFAALLLIASVSRAAVDESAYPARYQVVTTSKVGSFMIGNFCTMSLRDQADTSLALVVQRRGHGSCHVPDSGTVFHGRRDKDALQLLTKDDKGNTKAEKWPITGTVALAAQ